MTNSREELRRKLMLIYRKTFRCEPPSVALRGACTVDTVDRQISDLTRAICTGVALRASVQRGDLRRSQGA